MRHHLLPALALGLIVAAPAGAQQVPEAFDVGSVSDLATMAGEVRGLAEDRLLVRDMLGEPLLGGDGETVGTVEDFVVIPGGRLVAAMVETGDGTRIAVPFAAVKLGQAAAAGMMQVPLDASDIRGSAELRSLAETLSGQ